MRPKRQVGSGITPDQIRRIEHLAKAFEVAVGVCQYARGPREDSKVETETAYRAVREFSIPWRQTGTYDQWMETMQKWPKCSEPLRFWGMAGTSALQLIQRFTYEVSAHILAGSIWDLHKYLLSKEEAWPNDRIAEEARVLLAQLEIEVAKVGSPADESGSGARKGGQKRKITLEEANIEVRRLLKETPFWEWHVRTLAKQVGCSTGLIAKCPAWKAYKELRDQRRKEGTIKTVPLTSEMEAVLGVDGDPLSELTAEQEEDQQRDAGQAKLYPSHRKKREGRES